MVLYKSGRLVEAREKLKNALEKDDSFDGREEAEKALAKISQNEPVDESKP
jgi:hypothetical protein